MPREYTCIDNMLDIIIDLYLDISIIMGQVETKRWHENLDF